MHDQLYAIGIMTGNSLDGADLVLSRFGLDGSIEDIQAHAVAFPEGLKTRLRAVRAAVNAAGGRVEAVDLGQTLADYTALLVGAVADLRAQVPAVAVDLIGLHGQTCAHRPPSIAGPGGDVWTVQLGDGQALADQTGVAVVDDFRSDDLMGGGEGAPLAPVHHGHLARVIAGQGINSLAFLNAGNTGNLSVIAAGPGADPACVVGWDAGPFNHFPDRLMQLQAGQTCDWDGRTGGQGTINLDLLALLFERAVVAGPGENFLLRPPPRSSDPEWYRLLPELLGELPVGGQILTLADRVRTATYLASYVLMHSLSLLPGEIAPPTHFAVCGGGWRNPLCLLDFRRLLAGDSVQAPVLAEHEGIFDRLRGWTARTVVESSGHFGFDGTAMEARIFADAAVCRIKGEPFTLPTTTGVRVPTVCGIIRWPEGDRSRSTGAVRAWLDHFGAEGATFDPPATSDRRWSRARAGWMKLTGGAH